MALRVLIKSSRINNIKDAVGTLQKRYSQFPLAYEKPFFKKEKQSELKEKDEWNIKKHVPFLPASGSVSSSEFYDELTAKFVNYLMEGGQRELARKLMRQTIENIKRIQVKKYHDAPPDEKDSIELDPKVILTKAVENACPVMDLAKIKRGGIYYPVPVPLTAKRSKFLGMKWLLEAGKEKEKPVHLPFKFAHELIDAAENRGRVVTRKQDLYKQCEANRAYAHYRWM